jgi:hypothetical protein
MENETAPGKQGLQISDIDLHGFLVIGSPLQVSKFFYLQWQHTMHPIETQWESGVQREYMVSHPN